MRLMVPDHFLSGTSQVATWWPPYPDWQVGESVALLLMQKKLYHLTI
ncbi:hypothetical protein DFO79_12051 [Pseudidiomarina tainanensis]|uniref:Uncharacterized protein n=2 Tax=Pseudidiomarina TaxID=2800384 RepID=A0A368UL78_9GAMM|nr:hypothetical protein DET45_1192 [Pseudidiomarina maritima]RBP87296.1 hypothetical protein DFO81_1212 [Pseudidiomarina tainanensis]RCW29393.1 hypothetical protein DFO79_12051 [Pseudidiomarina tainanensis]